MIITIIAVFNYPLRERIEIETRKEREEKEKEMTQWVCMKET